MEPTSCRPTALSLVFWGVLAAFSFNLLDETLMNGGFVAGIQAHFWPAYTAEKFFAVNTAFVLLIALSNILYEWLGAGWVVLPVFFTWERALNGLWHVGWTLWLREYSPGLVTSVPFWILLYFLFRFGVAPGAVEARRVWRTGLAALLFETLFLSSIPMVARYAA